MHMHARVQGMSFGPPVPLLPWHCDPPHSITRTCRPLQCLAGEMC